MAPQDHSAAIDEIRRILKPNGKAFLKAAKGIMSYVDKAEWEDILEGFTVERRNHESFAEDRWALVSNKNR